MDRMIQEPLITIQKNKLILQKLETQVNYIRFYETQPGFSSLSGLTDLLTVMKHFSVDPFNAN